MYLVVVPMLFCFYLNMYKINSVFCPRLKDIYWKLIFFAPTGALIRRKDGAEKKRRWSNVTNFIFIKLHVVFISVHHMFI